MTKLRNGYFANSPLLVLSQMDAKAKIRVVPVSLFVGSRACRGATIWINSSTMIISWINDDSFGSFSVEFERDIESVHHCSITDESSHRQTKGHYIFFQMKPSYAGKDIATQLPLRTNVIHITSMFAAWLLPISPFEAVSRLLTVSLASRGRSSVGNGSQQQPTMEMVEWNPRKTTGMAAPKRVAQDPSPKKLSEIRPSEVSRVSNSNQIPNPPHPEASSSATSSAPLQSSINHNPKRVRSIDGLITHLISSDQTFDNETMRDWFHEHVSNFPFVTIKFTFVSNVDSYSIAFEGGGAE